MIGRVRQRLLPVILRTPIAARHVEYSMLFSADDDVSRPSRRLLDIALAAAAAARDNELELVTARVTEGPPYPSIWPGEHYRLLAGIVEVTSPSVVIEIGTYTGLSALALRDRLPPLGRVVTFDVVPWKAINGTALRTDDFADGRLEQVVEDLTDPLIVERYHDLLARADLIFIDAAKDGSMERQILRNFESLAFAADPIMVFDDIRLWNMLSTWRDIDRPKLDLTSFGHWSGTGLVDWVG